MAEKNLEHQAIVEKTKLCINDTAATAGIDFFQIALVLCSITILTKQKLFFKICLAFTALGVIIAALKRQHHLGSSAICEWRSLLRDAAWPIRSVNTTLDRYARDRGASPSQAERRRLVERANAERSAFLEEQNHKSLTLQNEWRRNQFVSRQSAAGAVPGRHVGKLCLDADIQNYAPLESMLIGVEAYT